MGLATSSCFLYDTLSMWKVFMSKSPHSGAGIRFDSSVSPATFPSRVPEGQAGENLKVCGG